MPELYLYNNPDIEYVPRLSAQVVDKTLSTMEQNHLKTIELQGELEAAVNAMDLDESENEYKAGLIDDIKRAVDDSTVDGYAGYALSDVIKKYGDIKGNPLLMGKVKANAAHKKYIADTQARTDITQDTKDRFIEANPYNLGKTDNEGNILEPGTYDWMPKTTAVSDIPLSQIFEEAVKIASPEISQWDTVIYQNADGSTSRTIGPNTVGYIDSSGKTTRLSREKLLDAVNAIINSNQEYRASLNQAFETQKWKAKNGRIPKESYQAGIVPGIDKNGDPTSLDEYIRASVDPFLNAKMYNYTESHKKYNPLTAKQLSALGGNGGGNGNGYDSLLGYTNGDGRNVPGNNISIRDEHLVEDNLVGTIKLAGDVRNRLTSPVNQGGFGISNKDLGLSADSIGIPTDYRTIENAVIKSKGVSSLNDLDDKTKEFLNRTKSDYLLYASTIDNYNNTISGESADAVYRFLIPLVKSGQDISQFATSSNPYARDVVNARSSAIRSAFYDDANDKIADSVKVSYSNKDDLDEALAKLGGRQTAVASGFQVVGNDIILDYEHRNQIENFGQLIAPGTKGHFYREGYGRIDYGGLRTLIHNTALSDINNNSRQPSADARHYTKGQLYNSFTRASQVLNSLPAEDTYNRTANRQSFVTSTSAVSGATIRDYTLDMLLEDPNLDKDTRAAYEKSQKKIEDNTYTLIQGDGISNLGIWRFNEDTNKYDYVDDLAFTDKNPNYSKALNEKLRLQKIIRQAPQNHIKFTLHFIDGVGWRPSMRIYDGQPEPYEDSRGNIKQQNVKLLENIILDVPDGIGDDALDYLNNDSYIRGHNDVTAALFRGNAVTIGMNNGINYGAKYNEATDRWDFTINGQVDSRSEGLSTEQVTNYRQAYRAAVDEISAIRPIYEALVKANPNEDIRTLRRSAYIQGLVKKHPQVNWEEINPNLLDYILFDY